MKKSIFFLTILIMFVTGFTVTSYAKDKTITGLGTGAIDNPRPTSNWQSYVYYGKYGGKSNRFRVLDKSGMEFGGNTLFLDCDSVLFEAAFDKDGMPNPPAAYANEWYYSDIRSGLNGSDFLTKEGCLTTMETDAIARSVIDPEREESISKYTDNSFVPLTGEKIFLLDEDEARAVEYTYDSKKTRRKQYRNDSYVRWLLRTARNIDNTHAVCYIADDGSLNFNASSVTYGISPAFNVNLEYVIFSSLCSGSPGAARAEYKLTLSDNNLGIRITEGQRVTKTKNEITIPYTITKEHAANATRVSVLITDEAYVPGTSAVEGYWYHKLADVGNSETTGIGSFTLPEEYRDGIWGEDYFVYILAEVVNKPQETDYASQPELLPVPEETGGLGTAGIGNPDPVKGGGWSYVWYGKYGGKPVKYRVLANRTTDFSEGSGIPSMLLDCDSVVAQTYFDISNNTNEWEKSDIRKWLKDEFYDKEGVFTPPERSAVAESNKTPDPGDAFTEIHPTGLSEDRVFLLDISEVTDKSYGYNVSGNRIKTMETIGWRLRSPYNEDVGVVDVDGVIWSDPVFKDDVGVSPAFNVSLPYVIFSSLVYGKAGEAGAEYKLTLSCNDLKIRLTDDVIKTGNSRIRVKYAASGSDDLSPGQVSAVVTDGEYSPETGWSSKATDNTDDHYKVINYGPVSPTGEAELEIPDEYRDKIPGIDFKTYLLTESVSGGKETGYSSLPLDITKTSAVTFRVINGEWDKGGNKDVTVTLGGYAGDTLKLTANDIPSAGNKPASGYKAGSWDRTPDTDTAIDGDMTYTYTYAKEESSDPHDPNKDPDDPSTDPVDPNTDPNTDPDNPSPKPSPKTLSENALEAFNNKLMAPGDTTVLEKTGKKWFLKTDKDCELTVVKGNKFFISNMEGRAEFDKKYKKLLAINKKGRVSAKKAADELHFSFNNKPSGKKITVSVNIIEPAIGENKKLKAEAKAGETFDFSTTIPLNAEFKKEKNKAVAEDLVFSGPAAIGTDGKLHIKGAAKKKGTITIPFSVYGKKFKAVIKVKP